MSYNNPEYLLLLLILVPTIACHVYNTIKGEASMRVSTLSTLEKLPATYKRFLIHVLFALRLATIVLLILVIARPQSSNKLHSSTTEGIDIMIAFDMSGSMLAEDLKPNRVEATKNVAIEFISARPNDNIGLVVFAGESYNQCPLTNDHAALINLIKGVEYGTIEDGTAIGLGLANAVNRMKDSQAKSKVVILLTDGSNNRGDIDPITAADIAKSFGIRVYTIGVGSQDMAPYPFQTPMGIQYQNVPVEIDEDVLKEIAQITNGSYFRATDNSKLSAIYSEIDKLEKTKLRVNEYNKKSEEFFIYLLAAICCLVAEIVLRNTIMRSLP